MEKGVKPVWKKAALGAGLLVAVGAAVAVFGPSASAKPRFETAEVKRGDVVAKVTATGTLSALVTVQVGSQVSGRIQELSADFNSQVTKGQVLARLDPQLFEAALEQAKANLVAAQSNLTRARVQEAEAARAAQRAKSLAQKSLIAQAELDTALSNVEAAQAQVAASTGAVAQAKAALHTAEINLAYTTIHSPITGVVISRNVDVGQTVAASLQAPTLFLIAEDLRKMEVHTSVAEADIGKLQPSMKASFTVDAYPGERFFGTVRQIRNAPQTVQNVVTYDAVMDVENEDLKLKPGMTANVTFVHAQKEDVLKVPNAALRFQPPRWMAPSGPPAKGSVAERTARLEPTAARTVWVLQGESPKPVAVKTGVTDGSFSELLEGALSEGDRLVVDVSGGKDAKPAGPPQQPMGGMRRVF